MESRGVVVDEELAGKRLDTVLSEVFPEKTRSHWQKLIETEKVLVNDRPAKKDQILRGGDPVTILPVNIRKELVKIPVVYQDDDVIVINKPSGVLVHAKGVRDDEFTVVDAFRDLIDEDNINRPGIVHRLDRDTSGVMILARNTETKKYLQHQFQNRRANKTYMAIVDGIPKESSGIIRWPIERNPKKPSSFRVGKNGKPAETSYSVLESYNSKSLVECRPKTGRTHQLRVHLANLGNPIVGDFLYNGSSADRMMLHAQKLEISIRHDDRRTFEVPVPKEFSL